MPTSPIIPADTAIETFRDNGYKNTASAISELMKRCNTALPKDPVPPVIINILSLNIFCKSFTLYYLKSCIA